MRRSLLSLILAALVAVTAVAPAGAAKPSATPPPEPAPTPTAEPTVEPTPEPSSEPTPEPSSEPTPDPPPDPTLDPSPAPTPDPSPPAVIEPAPDPESAPAEADPLDLEDRYIVVLDPNADVPKITKRHKERNGINSDRQFQRAFRGFSAKLDAKQRKALDADPSVIAIVPDELIELQAQSVPTGVSRVGARSSTVAAIDGVDQRVDADVAIVDTGVGPHPDLNIAGGYNCASSDRTAWRDKEGHGTHVAGTVAALDNSFGVVGVAPGARIWGVRILSDSGEGLLSWYVCGLDWILGQKDPDDPSRPLFEAVNMSVAKWGQDDANCGYSNEDILHRAICRLWDARIPVVAAAANDSGSASLRVPAAYNEVITVSALADTDGQAGGVGGSGCLSWGTRDKDDTFADFSNYGFDVDIIAPGKCINSTKINNSYGLSSGTSMAAPAVTGAVALYKATRPNATSKDVRDALVYLGNFGWSTSTDPDGIPDKLLDVSRIGKLGTFAFDEIAPTATVTAGGTAVAVPVGITRSSTFFETVRFGVDAQPAGWSTAWSPDTITGWTANSTNLVVSIPSGTLPGSYEIAIRAANQGRIATSTVLVVVGSGARWNAVTPTRVLDTRIGLGMSSRLVDGVPRVFKVTGTAVPTDATAVTGNLTITQPTGPGYVSIGATMTGNPSTSTINVRSGQTLANGVTVRIGPSGNLGIVYDGPAGRTAHAVFDITGYYRSSSSSGSTWHPVTATRLLDTRVSNGLSGPFTNRTVRTLQLAGRGSVPSTAVAVTGNLTVVGQTTSGYVSIGPSMTSSPSTSTINVTAGVTLANNVTLRIGSGGKVSAVFVGASASARTDLLLDVTGYYLAGSSGAAWFPVNASRLVDTRTNAGITRRLADGAVESIDVEGVVVPDGAVAVVGNLTLTGPTGSGYSTVASSISGAPGTSSINVRTGDTLANGVTFRLASDGSAKVVFEGPVGSSTHAIIDIVGYFR